jgi:alkylation response protein AidB-like acyl-CoA dehydrogenase
MDLTYTASEAAFREELRTWLTENPAGQKPSWDDGLIEWLIAWQRRPYDAGWAAVQWPVEHGGRGATLTESAIFFEDRPRRRAAADKRPRHPARRPNADAVGTEEQQQRFLATILSGEELWCQGFSEPEAGSDLASLKTRAVRDGDAWVVTGQKVWTSIAQFSRRCMLVARTDPESVRHRGLTYFALDMHSPGVTVRPLRQITGEPEFNELFLEDVRIPDADVVGPVGGGWKVALTTLANERSGLAFYNQVEMRKNLDRLIA